MGLGDFVKNYSPAPKKGGGGDTNIPETMTKMETGVRTGTGSYATANKFDWIREYKGYLIDIGRATTDAEAGKLALQIYDDLLKIRQANQSKQPSVNKNPRGTGGFKGTN